MALLQAYQPINMLDTTTWYGTVEEASSNRIVISSGNLTGIYSGAFYYDAYGQVYGTLSGYAQKVGGQTHYAVSQFAVDAYQAASIINSGDSYSLIAEVLGGNDKIVGSQFGDTLDGRDGNDILRGGAGNDSLWGDSGFDHIDGGSGLDTAYFLSSRSDYAITRYGDQVAVSGLGWEKGVDILVSVERLDFADMNVATPQQQFDALRYIASHDDLARAFGADAQKGFSHYVRNGVYEDREVDFNGLEYIASYADLLRGFGSNADAGELHYVRHGVHEGRDTTFDGLEYIASYNDLLRGFGANENAGASHFIRAGFYEGRSTKFDGLEYIASYDDLLMHFGADADAGARHFINNGFREGRARDTFDVDQYLANYADLRAGFGSNKEAAVTHYIEHGFYEGRTDDAPIVVDEFLF